jgi:hypothetical protein
MEGAINKKDKDSGRRVNYQEIDKKEGQSRGYGKAAEAATKHIRNVGERRNRTGEKGRRILPLQIYLIQSLISSLL